MQQITEEQQETLDRLARLDVMNVRRKKLDFFSYDLRQNLTFFGTLPKLKHHALIFATGYCFKNSNYNEIKSLNYKNKDLLSIEYVNNMIDALVRRCIHEISERFNYKIKLPFSSTKSTIRFVFTQIISFIQTNKIFVLKERNLFLKNIVLTRDGTVDTRKTVYEVLKENLLPHQKFKLASTFFLNKDEVKNYWSELSLDEKKSFSLKVFEEDFSSYYWTWKFNKTRHTIQKEFVAYGYEPTNPTIKKIEQDIIKNDDLAHQMMLKYAVDENNEMAVQYLWKAHLVRLKQREYILWDRLYSLLWNNKTFPYTHTNIVIYLLLQVYEHEVPELFAKESHNILMAIYNNQRWFDIYFKVLQVLEDHIEDSEYFFMLYNISASHRNRDSREIDLDFFAEFIFLMPEEQEVLLKDFRHLRPMCYDLLRVPFERSDRDLINAIMEFCSVEMIGPFFLSYQGRDLIEICIGNSEYEIINDVLHPLSLNQRKQIRMGVFKGAAYDICSKLSFYDLRKMRRYLDWTLELLIDGNENQDEENHERRVNREYREYINVFLTREYIYKNNGKNIKQLMFARKEHPYTPLSYAERALLTFMSQVEANRIQSSIKLHLSEDEWSHPADTAPHRNKWKYATGLKVALYDKVSELVLQSSWELLNELVIWTFAPREDKEKLGERLLADSYIFEEMIKRDCINDFYKFMNFVCSLLIHWKDEYLIKIFKSKVFDHNESLFEPFIKKCELRNLRKAIEWCDLPIKKLRGFRKYILHEVKINMPQTQDNQRQFKKLSNWLNSKCK